MEVGLTYSKIKYRKPNWSIAEPNKLRFCILSPNQEVDRGKIKESYLLFYAEAEAHPALPPPHFPPAPAHASVAYGRDRDKINKRLFKCKTHQIAKNLSSLILVKSSAWLGSPAQLMRATTLYNQNHQPELFEFNFAWITLI